MILITRVRQQQQLHFIVAGVFVAVVLDFLSSFITFFVRMLLGLAGD